jgi:3-isopropylmalate/(R)-2-methylmalate dehydratase small subunit
MTIDLEAQEIHRPDGGVMKFDIDAFRKHCMLNGLDDIGLTMQKDKNIGSFEQKVSGERPWM